MAPMMRRAMAPTETTARRRAERERDVAIDEAAVAWCETRRLREEVAELRREKQAWTTSRDRAHEQVLWHVGDIAEKLWNAFNEDISIGDGKMTVDKARLLALESLQHAVSKSETKLYEEMHELYAKIAHMETQYSKMAEKLRLLKHANDELLALKYSATFSSTKEDQRQQDQASQTTETFSSPPSYPTNAPRETELMNSFGRDNESSEASHAISLLQAQLAMYVAHEKRHRPQNPRTVLIE